MSALAQRLGTTRGLWLVVTGAGVSHASGIPTFRGTDPGAVWAKDTTELATLRYFHEDPAGSWKWYLGRFDQVLAAQPNPAHRALVALERWQLGRGGQFLLVTQNVDPLHERAGSKELVKVHGSADRVRCVTGGCRYGAPRGSLARAEVDLAPFLADPSERRLPRCPACGNLLRQHVLWFDEYYHGHQDYQWDRVRAAAARAEVVLFVGTSFAVGVTELVLDAALARGAPVFSVDPAARAPAGGVTAIVEPAEVALPAVCAELGAAGSPP